MDSCVQYRAIILGIKLLFAGISIIFILHVGNQTFWLCAVYCCAARVTVLGFLSVHPSVCLFVDAFSDTTGYETAYERYQQLQNDASLISPRATSVETASILILIAQTIISGSAHAECTVGVLLMFYEMDTNTIRKVWQRQMLSPGCWKKCLLRRAYVRPEKLGRAFLYMCMCVCIRQRTVPLHQPCLHGLQFYMYLDSLLSTVDQCVRGPMWLQLIFLPLGDHWRES